mgnify:CR=1 FL=1
MFNKENVLISACFLGVYCRYDGKNNSLKRLEELMDKYNLIPVCPEIMGGLGIPREPAEILEDKVVNSSGENVTEFFERGARETLKLARLYNSKCAILKERSPSCGYGKVYDGTFSGTLIEGSGMTADLLIRNGIRVLGESQIEKLLIP